MASISSKESVRLEHEHSAHNYHPLPVVFDKAKGALVWDPEGKEYIDMLSAYSAVNQGHCHPRLIAALTEQASKLTLSSRAFHNSTFGPYAKFVTQMFGYDMVLPMNTGVEAVETAIKLARKWGYMKKGIKDGDAKVWSVQGNFHGRSLGVVSMSTDPESRADFGPYLPNVGPEFQDPKSGETRVIRYGVYEDIERALELYGDVTAAFLIEPIQGEAGIVVPPEGYLSKVHALCKKHNVLLICDEIQTGLCRTGKLLASEYDGVRADVILLGKALSGGMYPVSAVLADKDIMLCIKPGEHGSTYGGNPLASAIATTALQILIDEDLSTKAFELGEVFRSEITKIQKTNKHVVEVRGRGLLNAVVISEEIHAGNKKRGAWELCLLLKERGVLAKPTHGNIIRFAPPLVISKEQLLKAVAVIKTCLDDIDKAETVIPGEDDAEEDGVVNHHVEIEN